jgi:ribosomal protein S17
MVVDPGSGKRTGGCGRRKNNECQVGDKVRIMETRPLSKEKNWRVVEILEKAK